MADTQTIVAGRIACAEAGAAERSPYNGACVHQVGHSPLLHQVRKDRLRRRVYCQGELVAAAVLSL